MEKSDGGRGRSALDETPMLVALSAGNGPGSRVSSVIVPTKQTLRRWDANSLAGTFRLAGMTSRHMGGRI